MFIPFVSVTLIGLYYALRSPERVGSLGVAVRNGLLGAWVGYLIGSLVGYGVEAVLIGGFWVTLSGHLAAFMAARTAVERFDPTPRSGQITS